VTPEITVFVPSLIFTLTRKDGVRRMNIMMRVVAEPAAD
jgi:hypothetical protein